MKKDTAMCSASTFYGFVHSRRKLKKIINKTEINRISFQNGLQAGQRPGSLWNLAAHYSETVSQTDEEH
jgi:hypothetical protein